MTVLGWIIAGIGLAVGVWLFIAFLDWLGDIGSGFTPEQAQRQTRRWLARQQPPGSTEEKP